MPITIVTGSTTRIAEPNNAAIETERAERIELARLGEITRINPAIARIATANCVQARTRIGSRDPRPRALKIVAPIAIPMRNSARITVNT